MDTKINLPKTMTDNQTRYINLVCAVIDYSSPNSTVNIQTTPEGFNISVESATPEFRQNLIDDLLGMHRGIKLKITFSSSLKISRLVSFKVYFADRK